MTSKNMEPRVQHTQRFNFNTYRRLKDVSRENKRSVSAEIEMRIEKSFRQEQERSRG